MRKKPLTEYAVELIIKKLTKMHSEGQDVGAVLDQSTANGWTSLYPLKTQQGASNGKFNAHAYAREKLARELASEAVGNGPTQAVFDAIPSEIHKLFSGSGSGE
jgi:hypothetical protein